MMSSIRKGRALVILGAVVALGVVAWSLGPAKIDVSAAPNREGSIDCRRQPDQQTTRKRLVAAREDARRRRLEVDIAAVQAGHARLTWTIRSDRGDRIERVIGTVRTLGSDPRMLFRDREATSSAGGVFSLDVGISSNTDVRLYLAPTGHALFGFRVDGLEPGETRDLGELSAVAGTSVKLRMIGADVEELVCTLLAPNGQYANALSAYVARVENGIASYSSLPPGTWRVFLGNEYVCAPENIVVSYDTRPLSHDVHVRRLIGRSLSGQVTTQGDEPVPDVVVDLVAGNSRCVTDVNGRFSLPVPSEVSGQEVDVRIYKKDASICETIHRRLRVGDESISLRCRPAGRLIITARGPDNELARISGVVLAQLSGRVSAENRRIRQPQRQTDGRYVIRGLQEGLNYLVVHSASEGWPPSKPRIVAWSGRQEETVRENVSLGPGRTIELRVSDAQGRAVSECRAIVCCPLGDCPRFDNYPRSRIGELGRGEGVLRSGSCWALVQRSEGARSTVKLLLPQEEQQCVLLLIGNNSEKRVSLDMIRGDRAEIVLDK